MDYELMSCSRCVKFWPELRSPEQRIYYEERIANSQCQLELSIMLAKFLSYPNAVYSSLEGNRLKFELNMSKDRSLWESLQVESRRSWEIQQPLLNIEVSPLAVFRGAFNIRRDWEDRQMRYRRDWEIRQANDRRRWETTRLPNDPGFRRTLNRVLKHWREHSDNTVDIFTHLGTRTFIRDLGPVDYYMTQMVTKTLVDYERKDCETVQKKSREQFDMLMSMAHARWSVHLPHVYIYEYKCLMPRLRDWLKENIDDFQFRLEERRRLHWPEYEFAFL